GPSSGPQVQAWSAEPFRSWTCEVRGERAIMRYRRSTSGDAAIGADVTSAAARRHAPPPGARASEQFEDLGARVPLERPLGGPDEVGPWLLHGPAVVVHGIFDPSGIAAGVLD